MTRSFTCIICPNGCEITAEYEGDTVYAVRGATCPKGDAYVRQELTDPQRNIATSVLVEGGELALADVCGLGADVIVTKNVARANA